MNDVRARPNSLPWPPVIYLAAIAVSVLSNIFYQLPWFGQPLSGILYLLGWLMPVTERKRIDGAGSFECASAAC